MVRGRVVVVEDVPAVSVMVVVVGAPEAGFWQAAPQLPRHTRCTRSFAVMIEALGDAMPPTNQIPAQEGRGVREPLAARRWWSGATLDLFRVCSRRRRGPTSPRHSAIAQQCPCRSARPSADARSLHSAPTATWSALTLTALGSRVGTFSADCFIGRHFSLAVEGRLSIS